MSERIYSHTNSDGYFEWGSPAESAERRARDKQGQARASAAHQARFAGASADRKAPQQVSLAERAKATSRPPQEWTSGRGRGR